MNIATGIALVIGLLIGPGVSAPAHAQPKQDQIRTQLTAQGFEGISISGERRIEVAAHRGDSIVRLVYDGKTGRLLEKALGQRKDDPRGAFLGG